MNFENFKKECIKEIKEIVEYLLKHYVSEKCKEKIKITEEDYKEFVDNYIEKDFTKLNNYISSDTISELQREFCQPLGYELDIINLEDEYFDLWIQWAFGTGWDFKYNYYIRFYFDGNDRIDMIEFLTATNKVPDEIGIKDLLFVDYMINLIEEIGIYNFLCEQMKKKLFK